MSYILRIVHYLLDTVDMDIVLILGHFRKSPLTSHSNFIT